MATVIPFGNRILVKRRKVGEKIGAAGILIAPDTTKDRDTDLADVIYVPDLTLIDQQLLETAEAVIKALGDKATAGDAEAFKQLLSFKDYLNLNSLKAGDLVVISKYVGITFHTKDTPDDLVLLDRDDVIGVIK